MFRGLGLGRRARNPFELRIIADGSRLDVNGELVNTTYQILSLELFIVYRFFQWNCYRSVRLASSWVLTVLLPICPSANS